MCVCVCAGKGVKTGPEMKNERESRGVRERVVYVTLCPYV